MIGNRLGGHPGQEFSGRLRDNLLIAYQGERAAPKHAAPSQQVAVEAPPPIRIPLLVRLRPAGLVVVMALTMFSASWGIYRSVPGDTLYPLKRASESALLHLSVDDAARARRELGTARTRASEAAALAGVPGPQRDELLRETLDDMDSTTRSAITTLNRVKRREKPSSGVLKRFAKEQRNVVEPLLPNLDGDSREKANAYLHLIKGFEAREP
jgi:hypothetical protein